MQMSRGLRVEGQDVEAAVGVDSIVRGEKVES